jgi:hypothetical protein
MDCIHLAQDRVWWLAAMNAVMKLSWYSIKSVKFDQLNVNMGIKMHFSVN